MDVKAQTDKSAGPSQIRNARGIVRHALLNNWAPGRHVTEAELVEVLDVSRSPVRAALRYLEQLGVLVSKPNHGYFLEFNRTQLSKLSFEPVLRTGESLYQKIIDDKIAGRLPDTFMQADLSALYNAGRPSILHALNHMESLGLIERNAGQGWRFLPGLETIQSRQASYEFRLAIEPRAIMSASFSAPVHELVALRQAHLDILEAMERGSVASDWIIETDFGFHESIARWSGNQFFVNAVVQQNRLRRLFEMAVIVNIRRVVDWCGEHLEVIAALEAQDLTRAASLMESHLIKARDVS